LKFASSYLILLALLMTLKVGYLLMGYSLNQVNANNPIDDQFISIGMRNDGGWYKLIAENGYSVVNTKRDLGYVEGPNFKQSEWAFFPLFPMMAKGVSTILHIDFDHSFLVLSLIFSSLLVVIAYRFGLAYFSDENYAFSFATILILIPFSFYHSMFYTEAIFLSLLLASFWAIKVHKYPWLLGLLIPVVLIRPNGILVLIPLYLYFLEQNNVIHSKGINLKMCFSKNTIMQSFYFITGPLAFIGYCIYQFAMTGYFFAFSIAQVGWFKKWTFPLFSLYNRGSLAAQFNSTYTIVIMALAIWAWKKLPLSFNIFIWISILLPLSAGSTISMARYISVIFPLVLVLIPPLFKLKYSWSILLLLIILHFASFYPWLIVDPLGY
jgi:hypothetical protein